MKIRPVTGAIASTLLLSGITVGFSTLPELHSAAAQPAASPTAPTLASLEQSALTQINQYRQQQGLPALTVDATITQQARQHSQAMADGRVPFSHEGFQQRVQAIARTIPYRSAAENVSYSQGYADPASQAVSGWLNSPGHRRNIEGQFNLTGIGVARNSRGEYYFTQIFINRR